jgi:hypothetical protein
LILELPELIYETLDFARHRIERFRYKLVLPESRIEIAKLIAFVGWFLIVVGVAGEWYAGAKIDDLSARIQRCNEARLAEVTEQSGDANARATAAYERASENEKETADTLKQAEQERADAAKSLAAAETARKEVEGFQLQIALANERASNAEKITAQLRKDAETEHLARVKLEQQLSWRIVTPQQAKKIAARLLPFAGQKFSAITYSSDAECLNFANELSPAILPGGWILDPDRKWEMLINLVVGIKLQIPDNAEPRTKEAAATLMDALNAEQMATSLETVKASEAPNPAVIKIVIGKSPTSLMPIEPNP